MYLNINAPKELVSHLNEDLTNESISDMDQVTTQKVLLNIQTRLNNYVNKYDRWLDIAVENVRPKGGDHGASALGESTAIFILSVLCVFIV